MFALINKELKLAMHPTVFIFLTFSAMMLIPSYPYYVAFFYTTLSIFFVFLSERENKDVMYSVLLPVRKRDCVKARVIVVAAIELCMVLISIPFAVLSARINPNDAGNQVGIEANVAFYGLVLIMYSIFNGIMIPSFYKTAYNIGKPFLTASAVMFVYIAIAEVSVNVVPILKTYLDTTSAAMMVRQLPVLAGGILIFALSLVHTYRRAADHFEKVDL